VVVETGPGDRKEIILAGGSRLVIRQNSRMTYAKIPGPFLHVSSASFDGEMALELNKEDRYLGIKTSSGRAIFTPGTYALKCEPGCAGMLVTVGVGSVQIRGEEGSNDAITLHAGEKGRVPKHGSPERVTAGSGWPALEPAKPTAPDERGAKGGR
jgi:ferric-dicitrate binding protein FerR (iron transport regulator)